MQDDAGDESKSILLLEDLMVYYLTNTPDMAAFPVLALLFFVTMNPNDEALIRKARQNSNEAIAVHDAARVSSFWTTDFHIITSRNDEASGKELNRVRMATEFERKPDVVYVRTPDNVQVFSQWKMASEYGHWEGTWTDKGQRIRLTGTYFAKWHYVDNQWLIRSETFVSLTCSGGDYCEKGPLN